MQSQSMARDGKLFLSPVLTALSRVILRRLVVSQPDRAAAALANAYRFDMQVSWADAHDAGENGEVMSFNRYAVYFLPQDPGIAGFGASWLGWDVAAGRRVAPFDIAGIEEVTMTPRKYGFHATLKPPFRLAAGQTREGLEAATGELATRCAPASSSGLELTIMGRFLALTPKGHTSGIRRIAAACVESIDDFRAAPDTAELERRRKSGLSARQEAMLTKWGYPYVMDEFRFHITLTGRLPRAALEVWKARLGDVLPPLPAPLEIGSIALVGERQDNGCFELIRRYTLEG